MLNFTSSKLPCTYERLDANDVDFQPGSLMLDFFPFLAYLPAFLQPWRKLATSSRVREQNLHRAFLRRQPETGNAPQCFGSLLVQACPSCADVRLVGRLTNMQIQEEEGISDDRACDILAMLIGAGADTTSSYLQSYKVMAIHPQTMKKAQEGKHSSRLSIHTLTISELGNIAGSQRLPTWDDEMPLPYVRALIKVHRWAPIGSLGSPYATTKRDVYEGRHIPEGDVVSPNLTAFSRSPE